ncbi:MAG: hypothetical protein GF310_13970 [candidate division Zixibacteria bacterium]|nr:hypothetical protein [candidate division Zixibacteria bacterium]
MRLSNIRLTIFFIIALCITLTLIQCSSDNSTDSSGIAGTLTKEWHYQGARLTFYENGNFDFSENIRGDFISYETGTYTYNKDNQVVTVSILEDNNGDMGLGTSSSGTIVFGISSLTDNKLIVDAGGEEIVLYANCPVIPDGIIYEGFSNSNLDENLWSKDIEGNGAISIQDSQCRLTGNSVSNSHTDVDLYLNSGGYSEIQVSLKLVSADLETDCRLGWNPYGNHHVVIGIRKESDGQVHIFGLVWEGSSIYWKSFRSAYLNTYYTLKMTWDGDEIGFYVDGSLQDTYNPASSAILFNETVGIGFDLNCYNGGDGQAYADNFSAIP